VAKRAPIKDLNELSALKQQLKVRAEAEKIAEQQRQAAELAVQKEAGLFRKNIGDITPLKAPDTYQHPRPTFLQQMAKTKSVDITSMAQAMENIEQWSDEFDASQEDEEEGVSYAAKGSSPELLAKLKKGQWPVQAFLDLHGMQRDQARTALAEFLKRSKLARLRCVCVIHGKGYSSREPAVLPGKVRIWLSQSELVQAFCPALPKDGGDGAVQVLLAGER